MKIKGEWEDDIYKTMQFIQELAKVQDDYYFKLMDKLKEDDIVKEFIDEADFDNWLFDYIFNDGSERTFEEYLADHGKVIDD